MNKKSIYILMAVGFTIVILLNAGASYSQSPEFFETRSYDALDFDYSTFLIPDRTGEKYKLQVFTRIAFNRLQFIKVQEKFRAKYEITVELRNEDKELIHEKSWIEEVQTEVFKETDDYNLHHFTGIRIPATHGKYTLNIYMQDIETKKRALQTREYEIPKIKENQFRVTSLMFVENLVKENNEIKGFIPTILTSLSNSGKVYYAYFEIIPDSDDQKFTVEAEVKSIKKRGKFKKKLQKIEGLTGSERIPVVYELSGDLIPSGNYKLELSIKSGRKKVEISKNFDMTWYGLPISEEDVDIALEQMKYAFEEVMPKNLKKISYNDKIKLFTETWKKRDPTPGSEINELKEEYFRRVRYSNANFAVFQDGWKSDRGMIYIIFGPPSDIIRYAFVLGAKPYQYWTYYMQNLIFEFYDKNGFGDFRLLTPYDNNFWNRPIR
jgi:GWxTD domain-containing protein